MKRVLLGIWNFISRHAFFVTIVIFVAVVGFADRNSFYHRFLHHKEIMHLQDEISNYEDQYERDTKTLLELDSSPKAIEKVARERYFMKKPNEDVYIFKN
ncbi:MAG: septum formation initiator family protein [Bacteroidaceae bacterium]|nr:septum formation initiator family protein [Bacteroidaceae bacterium]